MSKAEKIYMWICIVGIGVIGVLIGKNTVVPPLAEIKVEKKVVHNLPSIYCDKEHGNLIYYTQNDFFVVMRGCSKEK